MLTFVFNSNSTDKKNAKNSRRDIKEDASSKKEKVKMEILDTDNNIIRTINYNVEPGINRIYWSLRRKGIRNPNSPKPTRPDAREPSGPPVLPGEYTVRLSHGKKSVTKVVNVMKQHQKKMLNAFLEGEVIEDNVNQFWNEEEHLR